MKRQAEKMGEVNSKFRDTVVNKFRIWCKKNGVEETPEEMVRYMMERNIIEEKVIKYYVVLEIYPEYLYRYDSKQRAMWAMEEVIPYCDRQIRNIIANVPRRFRPKKVFFLEGNKSIV